MNSNLRCTEYGCDMSEKKASHYRPHLERSVAFADAAGSSASSNIIGVGGGASPLVDDPLGRGHSSLTVPDISGACRLNKR